MKENGVFKWDQTVKTAKLRDDQHRNKHKSYDYVINSSFASALKISRKEGSKRLGLREI